LKFGVRENSRDDINFDELENPEDGSKLRVRLNIRDELILEEGKK
jgi:hypothetical protein